MLNKKRSSFLRKLSSEEASIMEYSMPINLSDFFGYGWDIVERQRLRRANDKIEISIRFHPSTLEIYSFDFSLHYTINFNSLLNMGWGGSNAGPNSPIHYVGDVEFFISDWDREPVVLGYWYSDSDDLGEQDYIWDARLNEHITVINGIRCPEEDPEITLHIVDELKEATHELKKYIVKKFNLEDIIENKDYDIIYS